MIGDVYDATFLYGLLSNLSLEKTAELAGAVGEIKVTKFRPIA